MSDARILLLGSSGQIGHELSRELSTLGNVHRPSSADVDLGDPARLREAVRSLRPTLIVNAAADTAVDGAEGEGEARSHALNGVAPGVLAEEAERGGAGLVHFSTDYVFDGSATRPYTEADPTAPINAYGRAKLAGERAVLSTAADALVLRVSWVYDLTRRNFLTTMRRLAQDRDEIRVVGDQVGVPTWSGAVASAVAQVAAVWLRRDDASRRAARGVYHLSGTGTATWAEFAEAILRAYPVPGREHVRIAPIATSQFPTPARRPVYSVMDSSKLRAAFGVALPSWPEQLSLALSHTPRAS